MLSKSFKFLTFALLIITILLNVFINASPILSEKRAAVKVAIARFDNGEITRITGQFNTGFISENKNDYGFFINNDGGVVIVNLTDEIRDQLIINCPGTGPFEFDKKLKVRDMASLLFAQDEDGEEIGNMRIKPEPEPE
ncbi:12378_t:CDS:2 [Entrophospora sp. SA101]|nr:12378_t:CDS:2 [Entrophospora sp. SA101]